MTRGCESERSAPGRPKSSKQADRGKGQGELRSREKVTCNGGRAGEQEASTASRLNCGSRTTRLSRLTTVAVRPLRGLGGTTQRLRLIPASTPTDGPGHDLRTNCRLRPSRSSCAPAAVLAKPHRAPPLLTHYCHLHPAELRSKPEPAKPAEVPTGGWDQSRKGEAPQLLRCKTDLQAEKLSGFRSLKIDVRTDGHGSSGNS